MRLCEEIIRENFAPPSTLPAWRWMEEHIELDNTGPMPGRYSTELVPMARSFYNWSQAPGMSRLVLMLSAQSAKTQSAICWLVHKITEDPGPAMWVGHTAESAEEFAKLRLFPAIERCKKTAHLVPKERNRRTKKLIQFASMNLMLRGSVSRAGLQSTPVRYLCLDELREWPAGAIDMVMKRTITFHNALAILMGVAGEENDELHQHFKDGNQILFHWHCPHCQHSQPFRFGRHASVIFAKERARGGLVWDTNETTKPGGTWQGEGEQRRYIGGAYDFDALKKTVRYECEQCGAKFRNAEKTKLLKSIHEVQYNPNAPKGIVSMNWNTLYMPWKSCDWGEIVEKFLKARAHAKRGNLLPLVEFVTEDLGEPWQEVVFFTPKQVEHVRSDYRIGGMNLKPRFFWPLEFTRYLAVDKQQDHYWFVCRAFSRDGESRLVACGKLGTYEDIRAKQLELEVDDPRTFIDCAYEMGEVAGECCNYGWNMMRGDDAVSFTHFQNKQRIQKPYSLPQNYRPNPGKRAVPRRYQHAKWLRWSNPTIKDFLARLQGGHGVGWGIPADVEKVYLDQLDGERKKEVRNKNTGRLEKRWVEVGRQGCHMRDCECMILVGSILEGLMTGQPIQEPEGKAA